MLLLVARQHLCPGRQIDRLNCYLVTLVVTDRDSAAMSTPAVVMGADGDI